MSNLRSRYAARGKRQARANPPLHRPGHCRHHLPCVTVFLDVTYQMLSGVLEMLQITGTPDGHVVWKSREVAGTSVHTIYLETTMDSII